AAPTDDTKAARSPRDRPRQIPARPGRVPRQMRRSPGPDCPRRSNLPGTPEITSSARDQPPQRSASSDPPAYRARILPRESKQAMRFYTGWVMNRRGTSPEARLLTVIMVNRGVPVVFVLVADPISSGIVQNLGQP